MGCTKSKKKGKHEINYDIHHGRPGHMQGPLMPPHHIPPGMGPRSASLPLLDVDCEPYPRPGPLPPLPPPPAVYNDYDYRRSASIAYDDPHYYPRRRPIAHVEADILPGGRVRPRDDLPYDRNSIWDDIDVDQLRKRQKRSLWDDIDVDQLRKMKKKSLWDDIDVDQLRKMQKKSLWDDLDVEQLRKTQKKSLWDDIDYDKLKNSSRKSSLWDDIDYDKLKNSQRNVSFRDDIDEDEPRKLSIHEYVSNANNNLLPHYVEPIQEVYNKKHSVVCKSQLKKALGYNGDIVVNNEPPVFHSFPTPKVRPITAFEMREFKRRNPEAVLLYAT